MEVLATFGADIVQRYQITIPAPIRKVLELKGQNIGVGDRIHLAIIKEEIKGEGLETVKGSENRAKKPTKDNGGNSA